MGKNKKLKKENTAQVVVENTNGNKENDPWSSIEKGNGAKSARTVFYKEPVEEEPKIKHYERFKKKKQRMNTGETATFVDMHRHLPADYQVANISKNVSNKKRKRTDEQPTVVIDEDDVANVFASIAKRSKKFTTDDIIGVTVEKSKKDKKKDKKKNQKKDVVTNYIVEEPCDEMIPFKRTKGGTFPRKIEDGPQEDEFMGLDSDQELDDEDEPVVDNQAEESDDSLDEEDVEDEELLDEEDEDEEVSDEDGEGVDDCGGCCGGHDQAVEDGEGPEGFDDNDEILDVQCLEEMDGVEDSDEDEEEVEDEDDDEDDDLEDESVDGEESDVSEQDAPSDEEAFIGESRECGKFNQKKKANSKKIDFDRFPFSTDDSAVTATRAFGWIINACDVQTFFNDFYQSNALVIKRGNKDYYGNLFSTERLVELLEKNYVEYGTNINIASYKNGVRTTLNGKGRVFPGDLAHHLKQGHSVQLVNPQTFDDHIWYICEVLQELFHCFVGANTYLTPAGTAGFAPHWDEIDAFLLQLEGRKYWKVYAPRDDDEELPRESSENFTESDMYNRKPTFEGWLEPGDLLYIPRGFIHQAHTDEKVHSLHVTISTGRQWAFIDLLEKTLPEALGSFAQDRMKVRKSLPANLLDIGGVADCEYIQEENYEEKLAVPLDRHMSMLRNFMADRCMHSAIDIMAKEFFKTSLPPLLTPEERQLSAIGDGMNILRGPVVDFSKNPQIRLIRRHGQRLIFQSEDSCFIATRMQNSRLYEGRPEVTIDLPPEWIDIYNFLTDSYPEWIRLSELPKRPDIKKKDKQGFSELLYKHGLLMVDTKKK